MKNYSLAILLLFFVLTSFSQKPKISFDESEHNFGNIEEYFGIWEIWGKKWWKFGEK